MAFERGAGAYMLVDLCNLVSYDSRLRMHSTTRARRSALKELQAHVARRFLAC